MEPVGNDSMIGKAWLNGRLQYFSNPDDTGEAVGYYEDKSVWFRYLLVNGKIHGTGKTWYEGDVLKSEENYWMGELHGAAYYWYPDGVMEKEKHYYRGVLDGVQKEWFPNGVLAFQRAYFSGNRTGTSLRWNSHGRLLSREHYVDGRLHGIHEEYAQDGTIVTKEIYSRGVRMPLKKYERFLANQLPVKEILAIRNATVRRILIEEYGYARILAEMPNEVIDKDGEQELVRVRIGSREEPIWLVKVKCPSTGAFYTLRVPPDMANVKAAVAWTFGVFAEDYAPKKET
ncbi:MAG TPA: toxin-antitoxin system YwqK family antitoxin [Candidatus Omnitrophota bacterium]|nr:toxin-antitoxin system YwqK family antitoxin [Candidatus Omnitrophota bacterium]